MSTRRRLEGEQVMLDQSCLVKEDRHERLVVLEVIYVVVNRVSPWHNVVRSNR